MLSRGITFLFGPIPKKGRDETEPGCVWQPGCAEQQWKGANGRVAITGKLFGNQGLLGCPVLPAHAALAAIYSTVILLSVDIFGCRGCSYTAELLVMLTSVNKGF